MDVLGDAWTAYGALVLGFVVQALLLAKSRTKAAKWAFAGFVVVSLVVCEVFCHAITGWARLGVLVLYGGAVCLLLGALAAALLWQLRKK